MRPRPERLSEIDRELDALGKSEDELRAVVERARAWMRSASDLDGDLASLAEGAREAVARAASAAKASVRDEAPEPPTSVMRAAPSEPPPRAPSEPAPRSPDIAGLSVDELFADAEPSASGGGVNAGLADLFDDEPLALPDASPESGLADLFEEESPFDPVDARRFDEEVRASELGSLEELEPEPPKPMPLSAPPPAVDLSPFADEDDEVTSSFPITHLGKLEEEALAQSAGRGEPSGDFELLVDEDVLELEEVELEDQPPEAEPDGPRPGLLGRILGRK